MLVRRLMQAISHTLQTDGSFRQRYRADAPGGDGAANHPGGIAPWSLFLDCAGVYIVSRSEVVIRGDNPFPWPVTVERHGVRVTMPRGHNAEPIIEFPDGVNGRVLRKEPNQS